MTDEIITDAPLAASTKEEATAQPESLTIDEVIQRRTEEMSQKDAPPPEVETPEDSEDEVGSEDEPEADEPESISEEEESEPEETDVLSQFDLESLSEAELDELGKAVRSKVPKRFGELTKQKKEAQEEAERLRAEIAALQSKKNPLEREQPIVDNPFSDISTIDELAKQHEQFSKIEEWAEDMLDEHEDSSVEDIITELDGKEYTKRDVRAYKKKARLAREKFLPARLQELQAVEQNVKIKEALAEKAKTEFTWMAEPEGNVSKEYDLVINDPRVDLIRQRVPELNGQLDYLLAHAVNSMSTLLTKPGKPKAKTTKRLTPPSNPTGTATASPSDRERFSKEEKELFNKLENSNSYDDLAALRTSQRLQKTR